MTATCREIAESSRTAAKDRLRAIELAALINGLIVPATPDTPKPKRARPTAKAARDLLGMNA